jgi:hypothetical protein
MADRSESDQILGLAESCEESRGAGFWNCRMCGVTSRGRFTEMIHVRACPVGEAAKQLARLELRWSVQLQGWPKRY